MGVQTSTTSTGGRRDALIALDPLLLFVLGCGLAITISGDGAFLRAERLADFVGLSGVGLRTALYTGGIGTLLAFGVASLLVPAHRYRLLKNLSLAALVLLLVIAPSAVRMVERPDAERQLDFAHDGGVIQTEESARLVLAGENPYEADFSQTALGDLSIDAIEQHNPYLPLSFLLAVPSVWFADAVGRFFDMRFVYLALYLMTIIVVPEAFRSRGAAEIARTLFALNPLLVPWLIVGRNDIYPVAFLLFAYLALRRQRAISFFVLLALACALKQFAWVVAPFLVVFAGRVLPRRAFWTGLVLAAVVFGGIVLPFFVWSPSAFVDDVFLFNAGLSETSYPMGGTPGFGFAMFLVDSGRVSDRSAYYPLAPWIALTAGPLFLLLIVRLIKQPRADLVFLYSFATTFCVLFFSRVFHPNYLGLLAFLLAMGVLTAADRATVDG